MKILKKNELTIWLLFRFTQLNGHCKNNKFLLVMAGANTP